MMTKEEFIEMLKNSNISYAIIVRTPDWKGGYGNVAYFNEEAKNYELQEKEELFIMKL